MFATYTDTIILQGASTTVNIRVITTIHKSVLTCQVNRVASAFVNPYTRAHEVVLCTRQNIFLLPYYYTVISSDILQFNISQFYSVQFTLLVLFIKKRITFALTGIYF